MATNSTTPDLEQDIELIREKFEKGKYTVDSIPVILFMDETGVHISRNPEPNLIEYSQIYSHSSESCRMPKLNVLFGIQLIDHYLKKHDFDAWIRKVPKCYFKSREMLQEVMIENDIVFKRNNAIRVPKVFTNISMREALKQMIISCWCDMTYYCANKSELEADLNRSISPEIDLNNEQVLEKLEDELFYVNMCKLFGPEIDDDKSDINNALYEKSFMLKNFSVFYNDGNEIQAIAERGQDYFMFVMNF